jgi:predicted RNA-binding protein with PUA-like domain
MEDLWSRGPDGEFWDGVRNYQVRNMIRDEMKPGDLAFFYHSSCPVPGIAGILSVISEARPDLSAQNPESPYFDPKATSENPRWLGVQVKCVQQFESIFPLSEIRKIEALSTLTILRPGNRLSITRVTDEEWSILLSVIESYRP